MKILTILLLILVVNCDSYKILAIFPYNGRSHHIFFSTLVEELADRGHDVTVINYHGMKNKPTLRQISLQENEQTSDHVDIEEHLNVASNDILMAYDTAKAFKYIANTNCKKLMSNPQVQEMVESRESYDVVIVEQFVTDCGFAIAYKLNAPTVGITAHVLLPWTYSRLGAPNNPAFVANHLFASGSTPNLLNKFKSAIINWGMSLYYTHVIQKRDQEIVNELYSEIPSLEELGKNMSVIMLNQFYPLTGPRLYGPNVIEIGGMHISHHLQQLDKNLKAFLDTSNTGVVYISFGTVAANFPQRIMREIQKMIEGSNMNFVWKTDITDWKPPSNVFIAKWTPQVDVLCDAKVVAFVTHSGMLSTSEAMHCAVPVVAVPLFGDQFANAASTVENGLGVIVDIMSLDQKALEDALKRILQNKFQKKAQELSQLWHDRPLSPMDTAIYWIEYIARHGAAFNMKPPTVDMPFYQYMLLDLAVIIVTIMVLVLSFVCKLRALVNRKNGDEKVQIKKRS